MTLDFRAYASSNGVPNCDNGAVDCSPILSTALTVDRKVVLPDPAFGYRFAQPLLLNDRQSVTGETRQTRIIKDFNGSLFNLMGNAIELARLNVEGYATQSGYVIVQNITNGGSYNRVSDMRTNNCDGLVADGGAGNGKATYNNYENIVCQNHRGRGTYLTAHKAENRFESISIDYTTSLVNLPAIYVWGAEGMFMDKVNIMGSAALGACLNQDGFRLENCQAMWLDKCMADTVGGRGFFTDGGAYHRYSDNVASLCAADGFRHTNTAWVNHSGLHSTNNGGWGVVASGGSMIADGMIEQPSGKRYALGSTHELRALISGNIVTARNATA